jgi:hypothetical protein
MRPWEQANESLDADPAYVLDPHPELVDPLDPVDRLRLRDLTTLRPLSEIEETPTMMGIRMWTLAGARVWNETHPERLREYSRRYQRTHREIINKRNRERNRRAKESKQEGGGAGL